MVHNKRDYSVVLGKRTKETKIFLPHVLYLSGITSTYNLILVFKTSSHENEGLLRGESRWVARGRKSEPDEPVVLFEDVE